MSLRESSLRVALLTALLDEVKREHGAARSDAEEVFGPARADGQTQQRVVLPNGDELGLISIHGGSTWATVNDEAALLEWVAEHSPHQVVEEVERAAWDSEAIVALVKEHFPNVVRAVVRPAHRERLIKEMEKHEGRVIDPATDEPGPVLGTVHRSQPNGSFTYRPGRHATERIIAQWRAGQLAGVDVGPLALPAAPAGGESDG